ncbi:hypothetical protein PHMEG_0006503 [Phytophthora megakarya]|uniref:Uncharacterized protein n=1 Tax=Phytophthora megakarya TaxID=4795 RepID=A0A225WQB9_9STRA|nr:hypothetical protein PHMEG_0006503 [Phytophthora megakarya]
MVVGVKREGVTAVINRQRSRVEVANLPAALVRMHAVARTEQIPLMLRDVYRDQADTVIPALLTKQYALARRQAVPRVLSNLYTRLRVEAVPALLDRQIEAQQINFVPRTLGTLNVKMQQIAFPYVLQEVFERACFEAVPFVLRTIQNEIVARDMATNQATIENAKLALVHLWRQQGSTPTDFDAWIDDSPTGQVRTGFELLPAKSHLQLSLDVATILLGYLPSNLRFSLVDYDPAQTAADGRNGPQNTAVGFAIWKQVVALNETAIDYVLDGVNEDVASVSDYLTRDQLMEIRDYIITWAQSSVIQRDRQRFWRKAFAKRTTNSDVSNPDVDLDLERVGVQSGYSLQPLSASPSATTVSVDVAQQVWNASIEFSFVNPAGFTKWMEVVDGITTASTTELLEGVTGITSAEITDISTWIKALLDDGFVRRQALLHWTHGTCLTVMQLPRNNGCLRYDLEPNIDGEQLGFEMNPKSVLEVGAGITENTRDALWDAAQDTASFLIPVHPSDTTKSYGRWLQAMRTSTYTRLIANSQTLTMLALTVVSAQAIGSWLSDWAQNDLNTLNVYYWWRSMCWPREQVSKTQVSSPSVVTGQSSCTETTNEQELTTVFTSTDASLFFTDVRTYQVTETTCAATGLTFSQTQTTFTLRARVFPCEAISTGLADDQDDGTTGFELKPPAQAPLTRISLAAATVLWDPEQSLSFRNIRGYERWVGLAKHISGNTAGVATVTETITDNLNAAIVLVCQNGRTSSGILGVARINKSCTPVTTTHAKRIAAWVNEQSGSRWLENAVLDQWRRGVAGAFDIEPYRDDLQTGLELTTGCETALISLTADKCSSITTENGTRYEVPREALQLWDATHNASFLTVKGYAQWDSLASSVENGNKADIQTSHTALAKLCSTSGASTWEVWMERVFQWLQRWKTNEHLERDVLGHWLYASCPTTPTTIALVSEPTPQTSTVTSCTETYSATLASSLNDIQQLASRPISFFDANVIQEAALVRPTKTVSVTETWTSCEKLTSSGFTKTVKTRQSNKEFEACNLLSVLATPDVNPSEVIHVDATFELNRTVQADISVAVAQVIWSSQSNFSLLNLTSFFEYWYPAIDRSTALQTVQNDLDTLVGSSSPSELSAVQNYLKQWETSDAVDITVASLWITTNAANVDVDTHKDGDQRGFELYWSVSYKGSNSSSLPTLEQAKFLWKSDSVYSIVRSDSTIDDAGLPTGFRAWEEMYDGIDYESEQLVSQYPLKTRITRSSTMTHTLNGQAQAQLLTAMKAATTLSEVQIRGIARWLFNWATDNSLKDFVLAQWATGETFRGDSTLNLDLASHLERLYSFPVDEGEDHDYFAVASSVLVEASRESLRKLWDVATTGSLLDPTSRVVWCMIVVTDSDGKSREPCAHLLNGYGNLQNSAFNEFVALVQPTLPNTRIVQSADLSALALSFVGQALGLTLAQIMVIAKWYRTIPESSLFFHVFQLDKWSTAYTQTSQDPLQFGYDLAFVLSWNTTITRNVSINNLVSNVAYLGAGKTEKTIGECTNSLPLLATLWDDFNPTSFLHPTGILLWLSYARGEIKTTELIGIDNPTAKIIQDQNLADTTISCLFQLIGHWVKSWSNHPSTRMFVEEFWVTPITRGNISGALLLPNASDTTKAFCMMKVDPNNQVNSTLFATDWWAPGARVLLNDEESVALTNPDEGFALWQMLLVDCFSSDQKTGKCKTPELSSQYDTIRDRALKFLSQSLVDRIIAVSTALSDISKDTLQTYTISMIQDQIVPWLIDLLDQTVLEQYLLERVRLTNGDNDASTGPFSFVDLALVQFVNASVTETNYTVRDSSSGQLIVDDKGTLSERFPHEAFVFDAANGVVVQQNSTFLPGFGELRAAFCSENGQDRQFAYDADTVCSHGKEYTLSISDALALWTAFGFDDNTEWVWPNPNISASLSESGVPSPSALPNTSRSALILDAFLAQPFETMKECQDLMMTVIEAYDNIWSAQEKQTVCVDRMGELGVRLKTVYLQLPVLRGLQKKPVSFVQDMQAYLRYGATKFEYEPNVLGLAPRPPPKSDISSTLGYPQGGYFAASMVSDILFACQSNRAEFPDKTPLWPNASTTDRGASTFNFVVPLEDNRALYKKSKNVVGQLLAVDNTSLMNAWGEDVGLGTYRVTDGSQFTTAILLGENSANSIEFPPQKLHFYWGYARRVVQITFDSNTTRFGISMMRYLVNWTSPSRLPTGISSTSAPTPSLNMSLLYDDLPLILQTNSSSSASVLDLDPHTGKVFHRRLVWQLTAQVGGDQVFDVWHKNLAAGWLPLLRIEEEAGILMRMKHLRSVAPETSTDEAGLDDDADTLKTEEPLDGAVQVTLDQTEGVTTGDDRGQDELRPESTTRAWLHRA